MHEVDVDAMLRKIPPHQLRMWRAAYRAIPLGDSWQETDAICRAVHDSVERILAAKAGQTKVDPHKLSQPGEYIPELKLVKRGRIQIDAGSIAAHERATEQNYGNR